MLVFIDDSGDPGFKTQKGSSNYFIIVLVIFDDDLEAEKTSLAIKELRRKLRVSDYYEFKFNKMRRDFRNKFFEEIKYFKFRVRAIVVKKEIIRSQRLKNYKENFYNYIVMQVLKQSKGIIKRAKLKFDKRGEKTLRDELRTYLSRELDNKSSNFFSDLKFVDSKQNTLIQLADFLAGSIHIYYTGKDKSFLTRIKRLKKIEDVWEFK